MGYDPYTRPCYSPSKVIQDWESVVSAGPYDLIIASEVFEHFIRPKEDIHALNKIIKSDRAYVFITTGLYIPDRRTQEWTYLAPQSGQHVVFYARKSLEQVGILLGAQDIYNVGAEYEWFFVLGSTPLSRPLHFHHSIAAFLLQKAVALGLSPKIE